MIFVCRRLAGQTAGRNLRHSSYVRESVNLLATLANDLHAAISRASRLAYAIVDGTLIPIDRVAAERPHSSGKHKRYGMNAQILADTTVLARDASISWRNKVGVRLFNAKGRALVAG